MTTFQDSILGPAHGVRPSDGGLYLGLGVVPEQREDQIDDRPIRKVGVAVSNQ